MGRDIFSCPEQAEIEREKIYSWVRWVRQASQDICADADCNRWFASREIEYTAFLREKAVCLSREAFNSQQEASSIRRDTLSPRTSSAEENMNNANDLLRDMTAYLQQMQQITEKLDRRRRLLRERAERVRQNGVRVAEESRRLHELLRRHAQGVERIKDASLPSLPQLLSTKKMRSCLPGAD